MALTSQQKLAVDSQIQNIIVSAGAGSGKTRVLSERVFKHVVDGIDIDKMLVLTFTNAAAAEMKKRIRNNIIENRGNVLTKQQQAKQINKLDSSFIMTFDAYSLFIVKKYHQLLGIDEDIDIAESNIIKIKTDEFMSDIMAEEYRNSNPQFAKLIREFCIKDDSSIVDAIVNLNYKLNLIYERDEYVKSYQNNFYSDSALEETLNKYCVLLKDKINTIDKLLNSFSEYVNVEEYFEGYEGLKNLETYSEIREAISRLQPTGKQCRGVDKQGQEINKEIKNLITKLQNMTDSSKEELIAEITSTKDNELYMLKIAQELNARLSAYKKENRLYEFSDIAKMAIDVLDNHEDIRNEIKEYFAEILIDEYQDTSDLQEDFISRIANNNVYVVGDIKQSIYRFRNANPSIFQNKYERYSNGNDGIKIDLTNNFRSRKEVLDDINIVFNKLMTSEIGGADYSKGHQLFAGDTRYETQGHNDENHNLEILSYPLDDEWLKQFDKEVVEAFVVAKDITNKIKNHYQITYLERNEDGSEEMKLKEAEYKDFSILIDRSTNFDLFKQVLTYFKIPAAIEQEEKMSESDLMTVIRNIFKMLTCIYNNDFDYDFKYAYASIARSFLCEDKDSDIYNFISNDEIKNTEVYSIISSIYEGIETKTISVILDEIISKFDVYEKLNKIGDIHSNNVKIDYLYQLASQLSSLGYNYLDFNEYLVNVFAGDSDIGFNMQNEEENAVKITTIHKSKGLEYSVVYYPCLYVDFNRSDVNEKIVFSKDLGLVLPAMIEGRGLKQTVRKELFKYEYDRDDIGEKIRLFYVALTRAKEKTILVCPLQDKSQIDDGVIDTDTRLSMRSFKDMLDSIYNDLDKCDFIRNIDLSSLNLNGDFIIRKKNIFNSIKKGKKIIVKQLDRIEPKQIETDGFSKDPGLVDRAQKDRMDFGTRMHYYLETLDFSNPDYEIIDNKYIDKIKAFMNSDLMKDVKNGKAYKEYEFIYTDDSKQKHGFIDLLMEYDDHFDIIDYKLKNIDDDNYKKQLNGYREYIKSISNKKVNCYLYSIMDSRYEVVD